MVEPTVDLIILLTTFLVPINTYDVIIDNRDNYEKSMMYLSTLEVLESTSA